MIIYLICLKQATGSPTISHRIKLTSRKGVHPPPHLTLFLLYFGFNNFEFQETLGNVLIPISYIL